MKYKDRGILKWAPFDALDGHSSMIEEMIFNMNKTEKRILSDDDYAILNNTLNEAIKNDKEISVEYYNDGYTYKTFGKVYKVDMVNKELILDTGDNIKLDNILGLNILEA